MQVCTASPIYAASGNTSPETKPCSVWHETGCGITGDPSPSEADLRLTRRLNEAARILQIQMLDYVIIGHPINAKLERDRETSASEEREAEEARKGRPFGRSSTSISEETGIFTRASSH